ncbi:MAG TPA: DEAD/DEAH box helicase [Coxiellaceae bacterium]|nr:DEAD/DEAH box helicase [Coxiellaceae bacterium]
MSSNPNTFDQFGFEKSILSALSSLGYEQATPVQAQAIPVLMNGEDLLAQAQTGTGKTAAFALPILSRLDFSVHAPQAIVLVPTRELAIQVAEAFQSYARQLKHFSVAPIYGGQDFGVQLRLLKRGAQVIVATPGRFMDHLRRKTLPVTAVKTVILDEADEMLKMGFADDVKWILEQLKKPHQTALFSATIPPAIERIASRYLKTPTHIRVQLKQGTDLKIEQVYLVVPREQKLAVLTRLLEVEPTQGVIIFTRTKTETAELAERLQARGFSATPLNGDMSQSMREKVVSRFRKGLSDILVATDVAARGIDVDRVSHVINYDIPYDVESYVHRIGRTGRAGRSGKAILLVTPREQRLFRDIEQYTKKPILRMNLPSDAAIREKRAEELLEKVQGVLKAQPETLASYVKYIHTLMKARDCSAEKIAAAFMYLSDSKSTVGNTNENMTEFDFDRAGGDRKKPGRSFRSGKPNHFRHRSSHSKEKSFGARKKPFDHSREKSANSSAKIRKNPYRHHKS